MVKEIDDYLDTLEEKYPHITRDELKKVLEYGFYTFYMLNKKGGDIQIRNPKYVSYCGKMFLDGHKRSLYNSHKERVKLRMKYEYAKETYNGVYYFGLTDEEWELYKSKILSKKHNKKITFKDLKLYKIKEECFLGKDRRYFFALNYPIDVGWFFIKEKITTSNFKYIAFKDTNNKIITL